MVGSLRSKIFPESHKGLLSRPWWSWGLPRFIFYIVWVQHAIRVEKCVAVGAVWCNNSPFGWLTNVSYPRVKCRQNFSKTHQFQSGNRGFQRNCSLAYLSAKLTVYNVCKLQTHLSETLSKNLRERCHSRGQLYMRFRGQNLIKVSAKQLCKLFEC